MKQYVHGILDRYKSVFKDRHQWSADILTKGRYHIQRYKTLVGILYILMMANL